MTVTIEEILAEAVKAGASDVHVTTGVPPVMRVNGELSAMSYPKLSAADTLALLISVMTEGQRSRFEQRGEYDLSFAIEGLGRFRASAYKQRGNVALALRVIGDGIPSPEALGIPESVMKLYQKRRGLIVVAGPAGSGKSTTLAVLLDRINAMRRVHIITLEEPIEYRHSHKLSLVNQREIGTDCASYADGLRAALREDPDVILVGEIHDAATMKGVIAAAETGHLVLSAIHTFGAADAVDRMVELFPVHQQSQIRMRIAEVLEAVVSQRLLPDEKEDRRAAAFEVMHVNGHTRDLIREGRTELLHGLVDQKV